MSKKQKKAKPICTTTVTEVTSAHFTAIVRTARPVTTADRRTTYRVSSHTAKVMNLGALFDGSLFKRREKNQNPR